MTSGVVIGQDEPSNEDYLTVDRMYKTFGLTGKEVELKFYDAPDLCWKRFFIPARVIDEHKKYITVEILPHHNPYGNQGISKPYTMCINKYRIWLGDVVMVVDGMRFIQ